MFSKEQIEVLKQAEIHFYTAFNLNYKRNTPNTLNALVLSLYEAEIGHPYKTNLNCPKCLLTLYKNCGKIYFESIAEQNKTKAIDEPSENKTVETNEGGSQGGTESAPLDNININIRENAKKTTKATRGRKPKSTTSANTRKKEGSKKSSSSTKK